MSSNENRKKTSQNEEQLPKSPHEMTIGEGMSSVELRDAQGNLIKANFFTKLTPEEEGDAAWYRAFHDPDEGDIELTDLGKTTGEFYRPTE
jgi:hypothetical protein